MPLPISKLVSGSNHEFAIAWLWLINFVSRRAKIVSGNCFVTKKAFKKVGRFDDALVKDEDTEFAERLRGDGYWFSFIGDAWVTHCERNWQKQGYVSSLLNFCRDGLEYLRNKEEHLKKHSFPENISDDVPVINLNYGKKKSTS